MKSLKSNVFSYPHQMTDMRSWNLILEFGDATKRNGHLDDIEIETLRRTGSY